MKTEVVHVKSGCDVRICRTKDNKIPPAPAVGCFGNPFFLKNVNDEKEREEVIQKYEKYFLDKVEKDLEFKKAVLSLRGKRIGCFCSPKPCHGDVIVKWLENNFE